MDDVPEPLWKYLVDKHYVSEAEECPDKKQEILLKPARDLLRLHKEMDGSLDRQQVRKEEASAASSYVPTSRTGDPVHERARAAAPYLLKRLEASSAVEGLRGRLNAPLSREVARKLVRAPESARGSVSSRRYARLFWDGLETFGVDVEEGSMLWELCDTADRLPSGPWRPERLAWWLLTGDEPEVQPLQADIRFGAWPTVTLTVPAWATVETVGEFHRETKHYAWASVAGLADFRGEAESRAGSGDGFAPTTSPRRLAVFKFVAERGEFRDGHFEHGLSWRSLMELWNRRLPKKHAWCYTNVRNFSRDFRSAKEALFGSAESKGPDTT